MKTVSSIPGLEAIAQFVARDPGLPANIPQADIDGGVAAARLMNGVLTQAINATGVNTDGVLTESDLRLISSYIRSDAALYAQFVEGHGNDEGNVETGFHLVQGDGGALKFQGRAFVNTIADAIYHIGFRIENGRFLNEDGDANERVDDVAGWLNYFVNGQNRVYGSNDSESLNTGTYSFALADAEHEYFDAKGGNDKIWAGAGHDTIRAGSGNDQSGAGTGNDKMFGEAGDDKLWGQEGDDTIDGGTGNDELGGGTGTDLLSGARGHDKIWGEEGNDTLGGGAGNDTLGAGSGNDRLYGGAGNDKVWGEAGNDSAYGGAGDDNIGGAEGDDWLSGGAGNDEIGGGTGNDTMGGGAGNDKLWADSGHDLVYGGTGHDTIGANSGNDTVHAGDGNDIVWAEGGNDFVRGGAGNDQINGNDGRDVLIGDDGRDTITGGNGADTIRGGQGADVLQDWEDSEARDVFVFGRGETGLGTSADVIKGFTSGVDVLDLRGYGGLDFVGTAAFGAGPSVRVVENGVEIDADGNGVKDAEIEVKWVGLLSEGDFLL